MKVAICFPGCHRRGGVERVVFECSSFLAGRGHEVHVFAQSWEESGQAGITYHRVPDSRRPYFRRPLAFHNHATRMIDFTAFDVVNGHGVECPLGGLLWTHSIHRAWLEMAKQFRRPWSLARFKQRLNPLHPVLLKLENRHLGERNYKKLIALTPQTKAEIVRLYGVPAEDITPIAPGYSPADFNVDHRDGDRKRLREAHGYGADDKVMIFVANELDRKGFGQLIRAMAALQRGDLRLHVVGRVQPGHYAGEIERLKLGGRIRFAGVVDNHTLTASYAAADMFVLPTQYEGWGLVIVEALASGLPVLTSRLAPASVTVREGRTGHLLENPKNVDEIVSKLDLMLKLLPASPQEVSESVAAYAWSNVLLKYEQLLRSCAGKTEPAYAG